MFLSLMWANLGLNTLLLDEHESAAWASSSWSSPTPDYCVHTSGAELAHSHGNHNKSAQQSSHPLQPMRHV